MAAEIKEFTPSLMGSRERALLLATVLKNQNDVRGLWRSLRTLAEKSAPADASKEDLQLAVAASILGDLAENGWTISGSTDRIFVSAPDHVSAAGGSKERAKGQIRAGLHKVSDRQIASPAVQDFIRRMERVRSFEGKQVSIGSVIDSGMELSRAFEALGALSNDGAFSRLTKLIDPVIVPCETGGRCQFTGMELQDIWRYCRHTWSLEYNSLPGRTLRLLIRNRARPNWPIIGIAMLASPAANLYARDAWIGWRLDDLVQALLEGKWAARDVALGLVNVVSEAIGDIRTDDLLLPTELEHPTEATLFRLGQIAAKANGDRMNELRTFGQVDGHIVDIRSIGKRDARDEDWHRLSDTSLFRRKRAEQLVPLLSARRFFESAEFQKVPAAALYEALTDRQGRKVIGFALAELRRRRLASQVADLAVCGAIAPYNELIGGKLIALLAASRDVAGIYAKRYSDQASEIASQIAGRRITRSTDLKVLTTTSLYGTGSSQYNRLVLRDGADWEGRYRLCWEQLESSVGFTVTHVTRRTVELTRQLGIKVYGARRINSVFGEGSSPRIRQIREGLNLIGINNDHLLKHSVGRHVYACEMFPGARDALIGFTKGRKHRGESARKISRGWIKRWLVSRAKRPETICRLRELGAESISNDLKRRAERELPEEPTFPDRLPLAVVEDTADQGAKLEEVDFVADALAVKKIGCTT